MTRVTVILAGPDADTLERRAYPAFTAAGFEVLGVVDTPEKLRDVASIADLVVVEANLALTPDEALALLSGLGAARMAVILPMMWASERERFAGEIDLVAGFSAPVAWGSVVAGLAERVGRDDTVTGGQGDKVTGGLGDGVTEEEPVALPLPVARVRAPVRVEGRGGPSVRLGFFGERGGVGTSSAALAAARALAARGTRVALFDAARRGDLHLMVGVDPGEQPVARDGMTLFLAPPSEELAHGFDAAIVDGGRTRGAFNAEWVAVSRPLSEDRVLRLVGTEPQEAETTKADDVRPQGAKPKPRPRKRGFRLGDLISIEVTE